MNFITRQVSTILFIILFTSKIYPQVSGYVYDFENKSPLAHANVYFENTQYGTATNGKGFFIINNIPGGNYKLIISYMGYEPQVNFLTINEPGETHNNYYLIPETLSIENIIVTALRSPVELQNITSDVEIINSQKIGKENGGNIADVLKRTIGIYTKDYGSRGNIKSVSIRGSSTEQVLFLIDGIRIINPMNGTVDLSNFLLSSFSRIELVKGGRSSLYGTDAVGGIINLVTPAGNAARDTKVSSMISSGSFGFNSYNLDLSKQSHNLYFTFNINRINGEGSFPYNNEGKKEFRKNSKFTTTNLMAKSLYKFNSQMKLSLLAFGYMSNKGVPGSIITPTPEAETDESQKNIILKLEHRFSNRLSHIVNISLQQGNFKYSDPLLVQGLNENTFNLNTIGWSTENYLIVNKSNIITFGSEIYHYLLKSNTLKKTRRNSFSVFIVNQGTYKTHSGIFPELTINPSLRIDKYTHFKSFLSPGFGIALKRNYIQLKGNLHKNMRIPTFNELYWPEDSFTRGNLLLKPEESLSKDLGISLHLRKPFDFKFKSTVYHISFSNLINWQPDQTGKWSPVNIGKARSRGLELYLKTPIIFKLLSCEISHTFNRTRDLRNGVTYKRLLIYHPEVQNTVAFNFSHKNLTMDIISRYQSHRFYVPDNSKWLSAYRIFDVYLHYTTHITKIKTIASLIINNVADKYYQELVHYPIPGRNYRLTLQLTY